MNNEETIRWMEQQGHIRHWILPELGVNEGIPHSDHNVGKPPELMSLDCSLFNDLNEGIDVHVIVASILETKDPNKFFLSIPAKSSATYRRVWQGCPRKERIKQDMLKQTDNVEAII